MTHPTKQTMEQRRAAFAWTASEEGIRQSGDKYTNLAKGAPALIMASGLMQTLAFLSAKGEAHHKQLLQHLVQWLAGQLGGTATHDAMSPFPPAGQADFERTMQALFHATPGQYRQATNESMLILRWIRQMASAR